MFRWTPVRVLVLISCTKALAILSGCGVFYAPRIDPAARAGSLLDPGSYPSSDSGLLPVLHAMCLRLAQLANPLYRVTIENNEVAQLEHRE